MDPVSYGNGHQRRKWEIYLTHRANREGTHMKTTIDQSEQQPQYPSSSSRTLAKANHPSDLRVIRTQRSIREAFIRLMAVTPYHKITVSALSAEAGINRRTFYLHYSSIEDVVNDAAEHLAEETADAFEKIDIFKNEAQIEKLFLLLDETIPGHKNIYESLIADGDSRFVVDTLHDRASKALIERYADDFTIPPEELELYLEYFVSGILSVYARWVKGGRAIPVERAAAVASQSVQRGVAPLRESRKV